MLTNFLTALLPFAILIFITWICVFNLRVLHCFTAFSGKTVEWNGGRKKSIGWVPVNKYSTALS